MDVRGSLARVSADADERAVRGSVGRRAARCSASRSSAAIKEAFAPTFLISGALALLAAAGLLVSTRARPARTALASCAIAGALIPAHAAIATATKPAQS
jgi:hypothetical protein